MFSVTILAPFAIGILAVMMAALGGHLASAKKGYRIAFWGMAVATIALLVLQARDTAQKERDAEERGKQQQAQLDRIEKNSSESVQEAQKGTHITVENKTDPALLQLLRQKQSHNLDSLKVRGIILADKLAVFADSQKMSPLPGNPSPEMAERYKEDFELGILDTYHTTYEDETLRIFEELRKRGLNSTLELHAYNLPDGVESDAIHPAKIAEELKRLLDRLDDNGKVIY